MNEQVAQNARLAVELGPIFETKRVEPRLIETIGLRTETLK